MSSVISHAEREFIASGIAADVRSDGRGRLQWRSFDITKHVVGKAHGSAHTFLDGTEVMVAIYGEVVDKRSAGLHFHVDCTPTVVATYNLTRTASGKEGFNTLIASKMAMLYGVHYSNALREEMPVLFTTKEQKVKTTKYIDNVQREIVPTSSLMDCTDYGWILYVDIMIVGCAGGNVFGATSLAVKAALINVRLPKIEVSSSGEVMLHEQSATGLTNAQNYPLATVIQVHGSCYCVDPSLTEEAAPHTTLLLGTTLDGQITLCESLPSLTGCNAGLIRPLDLACVMNEGVAILEPVHLACITQAQ